MSQPSGPLVGVRVLSMENFLAGNHATYLMGLLGAEVIKIEQPGVGDALRTIGPFLEGEGGRRSAAELRVMPNKRSITLDMKQPRGQELFMDLVEQVDVFYTNQKPSSLASMGIDFEALQAHNPRIVYTTLSGFGHDDVVPKGPFGGWPAFDIIAQGLAGIQFRAQGEDDRPGYNGLPIGDEGASVLSVLGTVAALYQREQDGQARRVDVAMHDAMVFFNQMAIGTLSLLDRVATRGRSGTSAPYGSFRTADGWVNIGIGGDAIWRRFCTAIGQLDLADDERFRTSADRVGRIPELDRIVEAWTAQRSTDEVVAQLHTERVPCAPVFTIPQVLASPQVEARKMLVTIDDPIAGPRRVVGNPIKMPGIDYEHAAPPPGIGSDTSAVLEELLRLTPEEIQALAADGVVTLSDSPARTTGSVDTEA